MLKKLQKSNQGFTIIEVMIVLAIAGLIILIVLLAVPALQRNGRNTAIKNDASAIAAGISSFENQNDGKAPNTSSLISVSGSTVTFGTTADTQETAKIQSSTNVTTTTTNPSGGAATADSVVIEVKNNCNQNASNRAFAIWYVVETANAGNKWKCLDA